VVRLPARSLPACHNAAVVLPRPAPSPTGPRRSPAARRVLLAGVAAALLVTTGCVGRASRNDDHVGPYSYRPDAREHTEGPTRIEQ
jgi:hypothetical protein